MALSRQEVGKVARLARLELCADEQALYAEQLSAILEHAAELAALDLSQVTPTFHVLPLSNVLRADEVAASLPREEVLRNAPDKAKGCFRVPRIIE